METVNWDPVPEDEPELEDRILGVQGAFWSEFTCVDQEMEAMVVPRILGIAVMGWSERGAVAPSEIAPLARSARPLFDAMGWTCGPA